MTLLYLKKTTDTLLEDISIKVNQTGRVILEENSCSTVYIYFEGYILIYIKHYSIINC